MDLSGALKFNNFNVSSKIRIKKNEKPLEYINRVKTSKCLDIPKQDIVLEEKTEEEKDLKTIEWYKNHFDGSHGREFLKVLDEYTVNWKETDEYDYFLKTYSETVINPLFHGCGSIAASMILRFGFIVKSTSKTEGSGISVRGRMLGDGVYCAPFIDKALGYCTDGAYTRHNDEEAYIFEMKVILGKRGIDFESGGVDDKSVLSPEYCLKKYKRQIKVLKVYRIKKVSLDYIDELKSKYQEGEKINEN